MLRYWLAQTDASPMFYFDGPGKSREGGEMRPERIGDNLQEIPEWTTESQDEAIVRTYHLLDAQEAVLFVNEVVAEAAKREHTPAISLWGNQVKVRLTTPVADGLTDVDFELAKQFDQLAGSPLIV